MVRWFTACLAAAVTFGVSWVGGEGVFHLDRSAALSIAGTAAALVALPAAFWASRPRAGRHDGSVLATAASPPAHHVSVSVEVAAPHTESAPRAQILVGAIPREAAALQRRAGLVARLRDLRGTGRTAHVGAVTGLRGVGKTQLAASYARLCVADGWPVVVWIVAESRDQVLGGLAELADVCGLRRPETDSATAAHDALNWLRTQSGPCLLVYDNADDVGLIADWTPTTGNVQVVVTTTDTRFDSLGDSVQVDLFTEDEALAYVRQRTKLSDEAGGRRLAHELGYLPLALAQAAAVIGLDAPNPSFQSYLHRLSSVTVSDELRPMMLDPYPRGTAQALQLSIDELVHADRDGLATQILSLLSVLSPAGVETSLLATATGHAHDGGDLAALDGALALLVSRSLLLRNEGTSVVAAHRLIRRVMLESLINDGDLDDFLALAAAAIDGLRFPREFAWTNRLTGQHLLAQVESVWETAAGRGREPLSATRAILGLRVWAVGHLNDVYDYGRAIEFGTAVVADCVARLGPVDPDTISGQSHLAYAYRSSGRPARAIAVYEETLESMRTLGKHHLDTLALQNNLAGAYRAGDRLDEAVRLLEVTLETSTRVHGDRHPDTLSTRNNLAGAYRAAGRLGEATELYLATLTDRAAVLGPDHPDTLSSRNNLAGAYESAAKHEEAVALYERTLADRERVLGDDHPDTLRSRTNLAGAYVSLERLPEAMALYQRTLSERERLFGHEHIDTLWSRKYLADAYRLGDRATDAVLLYELTLANAERLLGADHPLSRGARDGLAAILSHHEAKAEVGAAASGQGPPTVPAVAAGPAGAANRLRVFLCHARQDKPRARRVHDALLDAGYDPWLDERKILGGQDWDQVIQAAVRDSDVVLALISRNSVDKVGYIQKELRLALDAADTRPDGAIFLIPVRYDDAPVPPRLLRWQHIDTRRDGWWDRLLLSLEQARPGRSQAT